MVNASVSAALFQIPCQSPIPLKSSSSLSRSMPCTGSWSSHVGPQQRWSELRRSSRNGSSARASSGKGDEEFVGEGTGAKGPMKQVREESFNIWEVLGGRGMKGGEKAVNTAEGRKALFSDTVEREKKDNKVGLSAVEGRVEEPVTEVPGKDMSGLVEEFAGEGRGAKGPMKQVREESFNLWEVLGARGMKGGEKGLGKFLEDYPPPKKKEEASKADQELDKLRRLIPGPATKGKTIATPLLMPGMTVIVQQPLHPFHNFTGIVQRVTDGRAGVLFEGGNWDKLVAFKLADLKRTAGGPPMNHPKSAILLQEQTTAPSPSP